ncbi:MAG TPA: tyrosine-type recombinase/integrase [Abditibacteriaceae bacterium]|nr:tyrosine-type recombinase/integrase [Abditibacteriaceae bacterium]
MKEIDTLPTDIVLATVALPDDVVPDEVLQIEMLPVEMLPIEMPVRDIYEAFARFLLIDVANGDATADTIKTYHGDVKHFVAWCAGQGIDPAAAKRSHIEAYREALKLSGLGVATRSRKLSILRRFYDAAVKHEILRVNPAAKVKGGKDITPPEEKIKCLTEGALGALVAGIPTNTPSGQRDRAIIALMAIHGLRRIEVSRLDHSSIETDKETPCLKVHGKANRVRRVFLRPDTYAAVMNYVEAKAEAGLPLEGALFLAHGNRTRGQRIARRSLNMIVDRCLNETALKKAGVSCHALRHTFGTLAVSGGAKVEHLRDAMGHSKLETTGLYVKAVERQKNNPANFIRVEV